MPGLYEFGLYDVMTQSLPISRRATKCLVPGASAIYLCNEGTGTTLTDRSGNGNHGTFGAGAAAPTWTQYGLSFDGSQFVTLPDAVGANLSSAFTIVAVVRPTDTSAVRTVISIDYGNVCNLSLTNNKSILYAPSSVNGYLYSAEATVPDATWVSVAFSNEWGKAITAYVNGRRSAAGPSAGTYLTPGAGLCYIGKKEGGTPQFYLGEIAAIGVWPGRFFSDAEHEQAHRALSSLVAPRGIDLPK